MSKNKKLPVNVPIIVSVVLALILLVSLWQDYSLLAYQAVLEKNIFILNENLMQYQRSDRKGPDAGSEAASYLKWKFVLKEQVEQTAQVLSDKAAALRNAGRDKALASLLYYNAGLAQTMNSNFADAIASFEEAVKLDPNNGYAYYNLGMLYYTYRNDNAKALHCYKRYAQIFPKGIYSVVVRSRIRQLEEPKP